MAEKGRHRQGWWNGLPGTKQSPGRGWLRGVLRASITLKIANFDCALLISFPTIDQPNRKRNRPPFFRVHDWVDDVRKYRKGVGETTPS